MEIGGVSPEGVAVPELGVIPLINTDTELEDKLPVPEDSPLFRDSSPEQARPTLCFDPAGDGDTSRGAGGGFSDGSVFISGTAGSCFVIR